MQDVDVIDFFNQQLTLATKDRSHPYRLFSVATTDPEGNPDTRTVVIRDFEPANNIITFHSNINDKKIQHIKNNPNICLLFYSLEHRVQYRVYAKASVHYMDDITQAKWVSMPHNCYKTYIKDLDGIDKNNIACSPQELAQAYPLFSVIKCHYDKLSYLKLVHNGNISIDVSV